MCDGNWIRACDDDLARIRTVADLFSSGWPGQKPHFDAQIVCPHCRNDIKRQTIENLASDEDRADAASRVLYNDGFQLTCDGCGASLCSATASVYDWYAEKEHSKNPWYPYSVATLPIETNGFDPSKFAAAVLAKHMHRSGFSTTEALNVPWGYADETEHICPACGRSAPTDGLDFHHWDYDDDIGVGLCRECHLDIHEGVKASKQSGFAGGGEGAWKKRAIPILWHKYAPRTPSSSLEHELLEFKFRFNIPKQTGFIKSLVASWDWNVSCAHEYTVPHNQNYSTCEYCKTIIEHSQPPRGCMADPEPERTEQEWKSTDHEVI